MTSAYRFQATDIEFRLRGLWLGLIFWLSFSMYFIDDRNLGARLANVLAETTGLADNAAAHVVFGIAALALIAAAGLRMWAASYLTKDVVHDSRSHFDKVVADGPYRFTRNPLYPAVDILAVAMAIMASLSGAIIMALGVTHFVYRLVLREEAGLEANQSAEFERFRRAVPRLIPSLTAQLAASGRRPNWKSGFASELFFWAFAIGMSVFAISLDVQFFWYACLVAMALIVLAGLQSSRKGKKR